MTQILITLERGGRQVQLAEDISQTRRQAFTAFKFATQQHHGKVCQHGEGGSNTVQRQEIGPSQAAAWCLAEPTKGQPEYEGAGGVTDRKADMLHKQLVEFRHGCVAIRLMDQLHFAQHKRMAADRALTKDHQVARKNIGASTVMEIGADNHRRPR